MQWDWKGVLHLLTLVLAFGNLLYHFVQVKRMPPAQSAFYNGSFVIWVGAALLATAMILPDIEVGFGFVVGLIGFGLIVFGFYLNQQRDKRQVIKD